MVASDSILEGRPYTENAYTELTYTKTGFHGHRALSRTHRRFHVHTAVFTVFTVFSCPFAHIFTYIFWFSRPYSVFTPTPCFHVHTVIFEFMWPNGLWTHFSCPNGPPGCGPWRTRRLRIRAHKLREVVQDFEAPWAIRHLSGSLLIADGFTKVLTHQAFAKFKSTLRIRY